MTKKEHHEAYKRFRLKKMDHNPSERILNEQWSLAIRLGLDGEPVENLETALEADWSSGGEALYNQQKVSRN